MKRKLIRDNVPDLARKNGDILETELLDDPNFKNELKAKLLEEAEEVLSAESSEKLTEEMADVLEVLVSLADAYQINFKVIERIRAEKAQKSGSFKKRLMLVGKNDQKFDK